MSEALKCSNCGSFNIGMDLSTGQTECYDCHSHNKPKKFDMEEYKNDSIEREEETLNKLRVLGTQVKIDPKTPDQKDLNDFSRLGL